MLVGQIFTAGAIYGGMRGDIKSLINGVKDAKDAASGAHNRIDNLILRGGKNG